MAGYLKHRRRWLRRIAYLAAVLAIGLLLLFAASFRWSFRYFSNAVVVGVIQGRAQVIRDALGIGLVSEDPRRGLQVYPLDSEDMLFANVRDAFIGLPREFQLGWHMIPLGVPTMATGLLAAAFFFLARLRVPPGHCRGCGYNLTGIESGRCPECGTGIEISVTPTETSPLSPIK